MFYENRIFALKSLIVFGDFTDFYKGVWGRESNWRLTCVITGVPYVGREYNSTTVQQHNSTTVQQHNSTTAQQYNSTPRTVFCTFRQPKDTYSIFNIRCTICVLILTECRVFHNFIFFVLFAFYVKDALKFKFAPPSFES
jgi:hypothetical protein